MTAGKLEVRLIDPTDDRWWPQDQSMIAGKTQQEAEAVIAGMNRGKGEDEQRLALFKDGKPI